MNADIWSGRGRLEQLVAELERQKATRLDFTVDGRQLEVRPGEAAVIIAPKTGPALEWLPNDGLVVKEQALAQFAGRMDPNVPTKFAKELAAAQPAIAARMLGDLMTAGGKRHFLRCLDGKVRAVLSDRYRVLDNFDLAFSALESVQASGGQILECTLSDTHMRLKFTTQSVWDTINDAAKDGQAHKFFRSAKANRDHLGRIGYKDDGELPGGPGTVHPLVTVSNSETGHGGLNVRVGVLQAICVNTCVIEDIAAQIHLGERMTEGVFTDETVAAESKAVYLKARDSIKAAFQPAVFKRLVAKCNAASADAITSPTDAVDALVENVSMSDDTRKSILEHFLGDYAANRYGLAQAVARVAQDTDDAETASDLENLAGKIINQPSLVLAS